jgi:hypothetical protein
MIKKTISALIVTGLASTSGLTFAADDAVTQISSGVYTENTPAGCSLLRDRVTVNVSTGVALVYNCITASVKVNLASCHASGSAKPTNIPCVVTGDDGTPAALPVYNGADCTAEGQLTDPVQQTSIAGRRGYVASTIGGSAGGTDLGAVDCNLASVSALPGLLE